MYVEVYQVDGEVEWRIEVRVGVRILYTWIGTSRPDGRIIVQPHNNPQAAPILMSFDDIHEAAEYILDRYKALDAIASGGFSEEVPDETAMELYTSHPVGVVDFHNLVLVTAEWDEATDSAQFMMQTGKEAAMYDGRDGWFQLVQFRSTSEYGCIMVVLWLDQKCRVNDETTKEIMRVCFGRVELYLHDIGEPSANYGEFIDEWTASAMRPSHDPLVTLGTDDSWTSIPSEGEMLESILDYVHYSSTTAYDVAQIVPDGAYAATRIFRRSDDRMVANLWDKKSRGMLLGVAHRIFTEWCKTNGYDYDHFYHVPYNNFRVD